MCRASLRRTMSTMPIAVECQILPDRVLDPRTLGDHLDRLFRAAWALCGSREEAEDLVQETYAQILARPRLLRGENDIGYLLRALRNTFVSQHRRAVRRPRLADVELEALAVPTGGRSGG